MNNGFKIYFTDYIYIQVTYNRFGDNSNRCEGKREKIKDNFCFPSCAIGGNWLKEGTTGRRTAPRKMDGGRWIVRQR